MLPKHGLCWSASVCGLCMCFAVANRAMRAEMKRKLAPKNENFCGKKFEARRFSMCRASQEREDAAEASFVLVGECVRLVHVLSLIHI